MKKIISMAVLAFFVLLTACSQQGDDNIDGAKERVFPDFVESSPVKHVKEAYAYAADHPQDLDHIPCYCGCGSIGHKSVKSCFLRSGSGEEASFDPHGAGCEICVQIVLDTKNGKQEGKPLHEIRQEIDQRYGERLTPTNTPEPPAGM
ncbi:PCYCGC motif-containing (lipo)protein [Desmospora activa]|uniref:Uncharacterized protein with PCYCGC motif n=1 Tax=Desmospora activa DSM 45169 TaxID=1121389 RepID=A0A2T4Z9F2_9BACL|nr:PCYCGC motif-containing (lipo)protein [Desmospora activa]PTM58503.1 uncharacterized protein with PCYCGC motif [Desmospora activa DSM 45169]